ncbi:MAG TPA: DUF456 domain-containing protein [bacterium]|nr:DUF456 domain-containing protein [bacterium]
MADIIIAWLGGICLVIGIAGSFIAFVPGPPLGFLGIILLNLSKYGEFSLPFLIVLGIFAAAASLADNILPMIGAQRFGGTKFGVWGAFFGLAAGILVFAPFGIIFMPFIGALTGEIAAGKRAKAALKAAFGSFIGFATGIMFKLFFAAACVYFYTAAIIKYFASVNA